MPKTFSITEDDKKNFASAYLLEKMINTPLTFPVLLEGEDKDLEPVLEYMLTKEYVEIKKTTYVPTQKGREVLVRFLKRYTDFLRHFDVYCAVDLESGNFAFEKWFDFEEEDSWVSYLDDERWEDLRVAVADFKNMNPVEIVFMSFLNEGIFGEDDYGWQFDLLLGSIWDEILEVCNSALVMDDLGYEDEDGEWISGEDVLRDVIKQGAEISEWIFKEEEAREEDEDEDEVEEVSEGDWPEREDYIVERVEIEHSPPMIYRSYYDPFYVNPVWLALVFI